jgi:hypothetical protein
MKIKILLMAALIGAAAMSANAGVRFGVSVGLPLPVVVPTALVCATPVTPAPVTVVETVPACPGVDYVWVSGARCYRPAHVMYGHYYGGHRW